MTHSCKYNFSSSIPTPRAKLLAALLAALVALAAAIDVDECPSAVQACVDEFGAAAETPSEIAYVTITVIFKSQSPSHLSLSRRSPRAFSRRFRNWIDN